MKDLNVHVLMAQGWILNPEKYTQKQLKKSVKDAFDAACADNDHASTVAYNAVYAAFSAAFSAKAGMGAVFFHTEYWIEEYFNCTDSNKQDYIDALSGDVKTTMDAVKFLRPCKVENTSEGIYIGSFPPVYTQEMADNGVLPSVGMMAVDKRNNCEYEILLPADINGYYVLTGGDGGYHCAPLKYLAPIDQRTDKEKAIDDLHSKYPYKTGGQLLSLAYDKWVK
jgi:hypothetical protein